MGCAPSRSHRSKLVALCRRRRDLVTAALATWRALGASHAAHLCSLRRLADALLHFADDALAVVPSPTKAPPFRLSSTPDGSHLRLTDSDGSHLHLSSSSSDEDGTTSDPKARPLPQTPPFPKPNPNKPGHHYMKHSPSTIPCMVYRPPPSGYSIGSDSGAKGWEFWDPFVSYDQYPSRYKVGSVASSVSSREVRRREGIPDLEIETDSEIAKVSDGGKKSPPLRRRESLQSKGKETVSSPECFFSLSSWRGSNSGDSDGGTASGGTAGGVEFMEGKGAAAPFEVGTSCASERSGPSYGAAMVVEGTKDVREVVWEIKKQFEIVVECGEELSKVLGVADFFHQRSRGGIFSAASSRISYSLSKMAYLVHPVHHSCLHKKTGYGYSQNLINTRTYCMSSSLEELCLWEKKMYEEIKNAEELHTMHEKKFRQQTVLRGGLQSDVAESKKSYQQGILSGRKSQSQTAESLQVSLGKLRVKIDITIKSVDFISRRIEKLRDEEMRPHLIELIRCSMAVWKCVRNCLQKQYQAIVDCKTSNLMAKTSAKKNDAVAKASQELEKGIRNWSSCFYEWLQAQKAFISSLNKWLFSWIDAEPGITLDGTALFSPARIGAPSIVVICNDWHHSINRISEDRLVAAMEDFAGNVHELQVIQRKEQQQRQKTEALSRDIAKKYASMEDSAARLEVEPLDRKATYLFMKQKDSTNKGEDSIESLRSRFVEEIARHRETTSEMHKMAASILRVGLIPVFEELGKFTLDMLKADEGLRIPGLKGQP